MFVSDFHPAHQSLSNNIILVQIAQINFKNKEQGICFFMYKRQMNNQNVKEKKNA